MCFKFSNFFSRLNIYMNNILRNLSCFLHITTNESREKKMMRFFQSQITKKNVRLKQEDSYFHVFLMNLVDLLKRSISTKRVSLEDWEMLGKISKFSHSLDISRERPQTQQITFSNSKSIVNQRDSVHHFQFIFFRPIKAMISRLAQCNKAHAEMWRKSKIFKIESPWVTSSEKNEHNNDEYRRKRLKDERQMIFFQFFSLGFRASILRSHQVFNIRKFGSLSKPHYDFTQNTWIFVSLTGWNATWWSWASKKLAKASGELWLSGFLPRVFG